MLIITQYLARHELKPLRKYFSLKDVLDGANKVIKNLAIEISPPKSLPGFRFFKVRVGRKIKGRMIVFMLVANRKIVPVLIRLKKDKIFGLNMSMNNLNVIAQINNNLVHILEDIKNHKYQEMDL